MSDPFPSSGSRFLVGLIGADVAGSLSRPLHENEASESGFTVFYQPIEVGDRPEPVVLEELVRNARRLGFRGLNVTHPCKQTVLPYLDALAPAAAALGAVNTIVFDECGAVGHNTDWGGFGDSLASDLPGVALDRVVQLGAGGAGAAVGYALLRAGTKRLTIVERDEDRAIRLCVLLAGLFPSAEVVTGDGSEPADGLVNATPIGMAAYPGTPIPLTWLHPGMWVADIIYRPAETDLLRYARALGCPTLQGGGMLARQAARGFELFTGHRPDRRRMLRHLDSLLLR